MEALISKKDQAMKRLRGLLELQKEIEERFGETDYNIFVFGSYLTTHYQEGKSDIDLAIYTEDFELYKKLAFYLEEYFNAIGVESDIFYIDLTIEATIYCAPLKSKVQFTDFYPQKLHDFYVTCQRKLEETKARMVG